MKLFATLSESGVIVASDEKSAKVVIESFRDDESPADAPPATPTLRELLDDLVMAGLNPVLQPGDAVLVLTRDEHMAMRRAQEKRYGP